MPSKKIDCILLSRFKRSGSYYHEKRDTVFLIKDGRFYNSSNRVSFPRNDDTPEKAYYGKLQKLHLPVSF